MTAPPGVRRLGLFGGSFDPIHEGHLHVAREAMRAFDLDHVVFMPAGRSPFKAGQEPASAEDRLRMVELAVADMEGVSVSTLELERPGPSYTIDTVRALPGHLGLADGAELYLLVGWDNLADLPKWRGVEELFELVQPVAVFRGEGEPEVPPGLRDALGPERFEKLLRGLVRADPVPVSSTDLRAALARGEDVGDALPPAVREYVRERGIYAPVPPPGDRPAPPAR